MHAQPHLVHLIGKLQIGRCRVHGIAADDHERVDLSRGHRAGQVANRLKLIDRMSLDGIGVEHRLPPVAEHGVHRVRERVHDRRLAFPGHDEARSAMSGQIVPNGREPRLSFGRERGTASHTRDTQVGGQRTRERLDVARLHRQPMVGLRAGRRRHRLCGIQTAARPFGPAAPRELARVTEVTGAAAEEIGVQRDDDRCAFDVVVHGCGAARRHPQPCGGIHLARRVPLMPHGRRKPREDVLELSGERRRRDRFGQNPETGTPGGLLCRGDRAHGADERGPRENLSHIGQRLHAIGVVEIEQGSLREDVGRAEARRVRRVAFDFCRPPFVALDEESCRAAAECHRRREVQRPAGHDAFGLPHVRKNLLRGLAGAAGHPGQRQRRAHQLKKSSPLDRIERLGQARGELVADELVEIGAVLFGKGSPEFRSGVEFHR